MCENRPGLYDLVGERVKVTSHTGTMWAGKLLALMAKPSLTIEQVDGTRVELPQSFTVEADASPVSDGGAWKCECGHLNWGRWNERSICGGCRFSVDKLDQVEKHYELIEIPAPVIEGGSDA